MADITKEEKTAVGITEQNHSELSSLTSSNNHELHEKDDSNDINEKEVKEFYQSLSPASLDYLMTETGHGIDLEDNGELPFDWLYILSKVLNISDEKTLAIFRSTAEEHDDDSNFPVEVWEFIQSVITDEVKIDQDPDLNFKAKLAACLIQYHSPYPEVRSVTDLVDDPTETVESIRAYTVGLVWLIIAAGVNEFFSHRMPNISIPAAVLCILMYPCGVLWGRFFPNFNVNFFGKKVPFNPGPYTLKEQMFATTIVMSSSSTIYVSYNIVTQKVFYGQTWLTFGFQLTLVLSTQLLGFSFAGLLRKFVVYPTRAIWPTVLPSLALNRALLKSERKESIHGWKISKYNFFWASFAIMFAYFWLPDYLFQALSTFNWMTWIKPDNFNLATITGSSFGLGFNPISTFDWNVVIALGIQPLTVPFYTTANTFIGTMLGGFVIMGLYYSNYKWTAYLPINDNGIYTNTGESFQVAEVLTNGLLDDAKYQVYSPPFYSAGNIMLYSAFFCSYPFSFIYNSYREFSTIKYAFKQIWQNNMDGYREAKKNGWLTFFKPSKDSDYQKFKDPHSRMMSKYKEIPDWYFLAVLAVSLALAITAVKAYPEGKTPVWGVFFTIAINVVFLIPLTVLQAASGIGFGLNVLVELIIGYALPGNGVAMMTLKAFGYNIDGQADNFISSQKMAHYAKVPPRAFFRGQLTGAILQCFVFLGVVNWSMSNIEDFCSPTQKQKFTCPSERTFYASSVFWGVIGPKKVFNGLYPTMKYAFLMGFLFALVFIAWKRYMPKTFPKFFEPTLLLLGMLNWAPYNITYMLTTLYASAGFMFYVKRRYLSWFEKYNFVLSAALSAGVSFSAIIIFFAVQYHDKSISWWGNDVMWEGVDGGVGQQSLLDISLSERGYFGPEIGNFP